MHTAINELEQQQVAISDDLLRTKLAPPAQQTALVPRPALLARLDAGLTRKVTLLSTPAGFGKTTLLAQWLASRSSEFSVLSSELAQSSQLKTQNSKLKTPVAWVALDPGDDDPIRFWRYVISACRAWDPAIGRPALAALRMAQQPALETVLIPFLNELAQLPGRRILVLEDYHSIRAREVHDTVTFLVEHLPDTVHLILTTRGAPPLPLARWRARNELTELTAEDLRFSLAEVQTFLQQTLHIALAPETTLRIEQRTEGWAAGLHLAALALQSKTEPRVVEQLLATFTGGHRHIVEYLISEVLAAQSETVQAFLLRTSFLTRLTGPLCDAVAGRDDSAQILEQIEHANLFLTLLGGADGQPWYRYHTLFAEAMRQHARQRLGEAEIRALRERAGRWYESQGLLGDAVEEAIAAGQAPRAAALIERIFERDRFNELHTLRRWIEQLPDDALREHPLICFAYANALLFTADRYAPATAVSVERWLRMAEENWRTESNGPRLGQVAALRAIVASWQGDAPRSFACAHQALDLLDEHDVMYRSASLLLGGQEQLLAGRIDAAQRLFMEARTLSEIDGNIHGTLAATSLLGDVCFQQGELDQAAYYYQHVLAEAVGGDEMLDDQAYALCGLGAIAYEQDDLETAERQAAQARELALRRHAEDLQVRAALILARVQIAQGQTEQARHLLQSLATQPRQPALAQEVRDWQARLALAAGDLEAAQRWRAAITSQPEQVARAQDEREALIVARVQIAQGDAQAALELLERWRADAVAQGRIRSEIEILALKALAHFAQAEESQAQPALTRALALCQSHGLRHILLDEGEPIAALLRAIAPSLTRRPLAAYAASLLRALSPGMTDAAQSAGLPLLEPLSPQEQRVLRLLVAGRSNPEIARELVVSTNTIKTHVKDIYRKLNVGTREEAQAAARELNLR